MASTDDILAAVKEVDKKATNLLQWQATMNERCTNHRIETDALKNTVFGEGDAKGLKEKVGTLFSCVKQLKAIKDYWVYVAKIVTAGGVLAFLIWVLNVYKVIGGE